MATTRLRRQKRRQRWEEGVGAYMQAQRRGGMLPVQAAYRNPTNQRELTAALDNQNGRHYEIPPGAEDVFEHTEIPYSSGRIVFNITDQNRNTTARRAANWAPLTIQDNMPPAEWPVRMLDIINGGVQPVRMSDFNNVPAFAGEDAIYDYEPVAPYVNRISNFRGAEIQSLREAGAFWDLFENRPPQDGQSESAYRFRGVDRIRNYGNAWLTLYYALSDMLLFQPSLRAIVMTFQEIAEDIVGMGVPPLTRVMIDLEGNSDPPHGLGREFLQIVAHSPDHNVAQISFSRVLNLWTMINKPEAIFEVMAIAFQSERFEHFNMKRVYISILIEARGGEGVTIPASIIKVRENLKKTIADFKPIENSDDNSCGLQALFNGMLCANQSVLALCKKSPGTKLVPINKVLENVRKQAVRKKIKLFDFKQDQFAFLAQSFGWKTGTTISYQELKLAITSFNTNYGTKFGLLIFDGLKPFRRPFTTFSCDPKEIPSNEHMVVLIHFQWAQTGHYDWLNRRAIVRFIRGQPKKNLSYDFVSLKCMGRGVKPRDGFQCDGCNGYQTLIHPNEWELKHNGNYKTNKIKCGDCNRMFRSEECYVMHRLKQKNQFATACERIMFCAECKRPHERTKDCNMKWCRGCSKKYLKTDDKHVCFIYAISDKKLTNARDVIYADIESKRVKDKRDGKRIVQESYSVCAYYCQRCSIHKLNRKKKCEECADLIVQLSCSNCAEKCSCKWSWVYFEGGSCVGDFLEWLLNEHPGSTVVMHNGGKFDFQLISEFICYDRRFTKKDVCRGLKILTMNVYYDMATDDEVKKGNSGVHFIDSLNFIPSSLRALSKMFNLPTVKGHFPFEILNDDEWETKFKGDKPPSLQYFGFSALELKSRDKLSDNRRADMDSVTKWREEWKGDYVPRNELRKYNIQDVVLLQQACDLFRQNFRRMTGLDPFRFITTPSAVASSYRQDKYMKPDSIQSFSVADRQWQRTAIRGGRTEPFKLYYRCREGEEIKVVDINSSYPFQQSYKNYPVGEVSFDRSYSPPASFFTVAKDVLRETTSNLWDILNDPTGRYGCGIIECDWIDVTYDYVPILPLKVKTGSSEKLLFQSRSGKWTGFISLLAAAIQAKQVVVRFINRIQLWTHTSDKVFQKYMLTLYAKKVEASGWDSILKEMPADSKDPKAEFLAECKQRGVILDENNIKENPGLKATAKIKANSCWGYLTQKATKDTNQYFDNDDKEAVEAMGDFLETLGSDINPHRLVGKIAGIGRFTKVHSTLISPLDETEEDKNKNVAYHVGGQVPAYGLQQITEGLRSLDSSQILYTDTDSLTYVYDKKNPLHKDIKTGPYLGDYSDEYPGCKITEYVCLGPKTYCLKIEKGGMVCYKTKFKGLPLLQPGFSLKDEDEKIAQVGMTEMKDLLESALLSRIEENENELVYRFHYTNVFKKNNDFKISTAEEKKSLRFTFDKRNVLIPDNFTGLDKVYMIDTLPFSEDAEVYNKKEVKEWWDERREELTKYVTTFYEEMM